MCTTHPIHEQPLSMQITYRMLLIHTGTAKSDYKLDWEILERRHFGETFLLVCFIP